MECGPSSPMTESIRTMRDIASWRRWPSRRSRQHCGGRLRVVACIALVVAFLITEGCDNLSTAERELVHTDAEIFEAVAQSERVVGMEDSSRSPRFLRIDWRPIDNTTVLSPQPPGATGIALNDSALPAPA